MTERQNKAAWLQPAPVVSRSRYRAADSGLWETPWVPHSHHQPFTLPVSSPHYAPFSQEKEVAWDSASSQTWWRFHLLQDKTRRECMWCNWSPGRKGTVEHINHGRTPSAHDSLKRRRLSIFTLRYLGNAALYGFYNLPVVPSRMSLAPFWGLSDRWLAL